MPERRSPPRHGGMCCLERHLAGDLETDHGAEQCGTLDKGSQNERSGLDATSGFRLTGHALDGASTDVTDADAGTNDRQTCGKAGADHGETLRVGLDFCNSLKERKN